MQGVGEPQRAERAEGISTDQTDSNLYLRNFSCTLSEVHA